jgi:hypothetical protein
VYRGYCRGRIRCSLLLVGWNVTPRGEEQNGPYVARKTEGSKPSE